LLLKRVRRWLAILREIRTPIASIGRSTTTSTFTTTPPVITLVTRIVWILKTWLPSLLMHHGHVWVIIIERVPRRLRIMPWRRSSKATIWILRR